MASIVDVIKDTEDWLRLNILNHSGLADALLAILHNDDKDPSYNGLPKDPRLLLYTEFNTTWLPTIDELSRKRTINPTQRKKLLPANQKVNTKEFDVSLIIILIINCTDLPAPSTGWDVRQTLSPTDNSKAANVLRAREWRNFIYHTGHKEINDAIFKAKWKDGENILKALLSNFDTNALKITPLDPTTSTLQHALIKSLEDFCTQEVVKNSADIKDVKSFLKAHGEQLKKHDEAIAGQGEQLRKQGDEIAGQGQQLKKQGEDITKQGEQLKKHDEAITRQDDKLRKQGEDITGQGQHLKKQSEDIAGQGQQLKKQGEDIAGQGEQLQKHDSDITGQGQQLKKQSEDIAGHGEQLKQHDSDIAGQGLQLKKQDEAIAGHGKQLKNLDETVTKLKICQEGSVMSLLHIFKLFAGMFLFDLLLFTIVSFLQVTFLIL